MTDEADKLAKIILGTMGIAALGAVASYVVSGVYIMVTSDYSVCMPSLLEIYHPVVHGVISSSIIVIFLVGLSVTATFGLKAITDILDWMKR